MDASPILAQIARALLNAKLDAVLIGNAAAALQGAPVTTIDFDFMIRDTPGNLRKIKAVARTLGGVVFWPFYPMSKLYRLVNDDAGLQVDFMPVIHGVRSFESLRSRSTLVQMRGQALRVASLEDVIRSKRATGRARDKAVLPVLEATLRERDRAK